MASPPLRRFLDSDVITRLVENRDEAPTIERLIQEAASGRWQVIVTSVTLLEVSRQRNTFDPTKHAKIMSFFENEYVFVRDLDVVLAEKAIKLIYDYTWLHPMDAAHLAAAIDMGCQAFYTYDDDLVNRFDTERNLRVVKPDMPLEVDLSDMPLFNQPPSLGS